MKPGPQLRAWQRDTHGRVRLARTVAALLTGAYSATDLACLLRVSIDTARRDIAALRFGGVPMRRSAHCRWQIVPDGWPEPWPAAGPASMEPHQQGHATRPGACAR